MSGELPGSLGETGAGPPEQAAGDAVRSREERPDLEPRIYVASLSDYNNGLLHGAWLRADDTVEDLQEAIDVMLTASPWARRTGEPAEEWRIDDYEGFGEYLDIGGFENLATVAALADGVTQHGAAFGAWVMHEGVADPEELAQFEEYFMGEFASAEEFGEDQLESLGVNLDEVEGIPEVVRPYVSIDVGAWVRDMEMGGVLSVVERPSGGVYAFWK